MTSGPASGPEARVLAAVPKQLLIGAGWRPAASGRTVAVEDPATGATLTEVADGDARDALAALEAAHAAQSDWAATPARSAARSSGAASRRSWTRSTTSPC